MEKSTYSVQKCSPKSGNLFRERPFSKRQWMSVDSGPDFGQLATFGLQHIQFSYSVWNPDEEVFKIRTELNFLKAL